MTISPTPPGSHINDSSPPKPLGAAPGSRFYVPELDVVRLFAFLSVFSFHVHFVPVVVWKPGLARSAALAGSVGVDLFFTLSAYLITTLLLKEREETGTVDTRSFYVRRILRIWPVYFSFIGVIYLMSHFARVFSTSSIYLIALLTFTVNFGIILQDYFPPGRWQASFVVTPLWSISVEEQFYLLWPLLIRKVSRRGAIIAALSMLLVTTLDRIRAVELGSLGFPSAIMTRLTYADSFAVGILLATLPLPKLTANLRLIPRALLVVAGLSAWVGAIHFGDYSSPFASMTQALFTYPAIAAGNGALVLAALGAGKAGAGFMLNEKLRYLGKISYGLYVYHCLAILSAQQLMFKMMFPVLTWLGCPLWFGRPVYFILALTLTILLAAASYRWLESPFLRLKDRFTRVPSRPV